MKRIRHFKKSRGTALMIGVFMCCGLIIAIEVPLSILDLPESSYYRPYPSLYFTMNRFGIKGPMPGNHRIRSERKADGETIYDVSYAIDQKGRRITPVNNRSQRYKFLLFFGGSFTYGEGVEADQTLPYYAGTLTATYMPYNYGFHGLGPFDILAKLETTNFAKEVEEREGVIIYTFIDAHIRRTFCPLSIASWQSNQAYYDIPEMGRLIRKGSFDSQFPFKISLYKMLSQSRFLKMLRLDLPPRITKTHVKNTARVMEEMNYYVKERFPQSSFYVLFYPGQSEYATQLIPYLNKKDIRYLDYSTLFDGYNDPQFFLAEEDRHPSAHAYRTVANTLVQELQLD